ncbi:MAG: 50S ribosomal protein L32 [Chloroflexi bacterium]|nr:50S ribosomal protein L32 [Chloroflexota bacterium]
MPPLPKKQLSKAKQRRRAAHYRIRAVGLSRCPQCQSAKLPHHVCPTCGYYRGREVVKVREEQAPG